MSLPRLRRPSRFIAVVLLLAAARLPHIAGDDGACLPGAIPSYVAHDESQHSLESGSPHEDDHCAVCHWTRSLRSPRTAVASAAAQVNPPTLLHRSDAAAARSADVAHLPARAPPSALL
jgi:hypothetical protein